MAAKTVRALVYGLMAKCVQLTRPKLVLPDGTYILKPKLPIWVSFGRSCNGTFGIFYSHLFYFTAKLYILWAFGTFSIFFSVLVCCSEKDLATLVQTDLG
jgi:hypothetical protein